MRSIPYNVQDDFCAGERWHPWVRFDTEHPYHLKGRVQLQKSLARLTHHCTCKCKKVAHISMHRIPFVIAVFFILAYFTRCAYSTCRLITRGMPSTHKFSKTAYMWEKRWARVYYTQRGDVTTSGDEMRSASKEGERIAYIDRNFCIFSHIWRKATWERELGWKEEHKWKNMCSSHIVASPPTSLSLPQIRWVSIKERLATNFGILRDSK